MKRSRGRSGKEDNESRTGIAKRNEWQRRKKNRERRRYDGK